MNPTTSAFLSSWETDPVVLAGLLIAGVLYAAGLRNVRRRAGRDALVPRWRTAAFYSGLLMVALALLSPIATFASLLFSMHMAQHLVLTIFAAPLLMLGQPLLPMLWAFPLRLRRAIGIGVKPGAPLHSVVSWMTQPVPAILLHNGAVLVWHLQFMYEASLTSQEMHYLQHALMLGTALLFWWPVIRPLPHAHQRAKRSGIALLVLASAALAQGKFLGGLLTFSDTAAYTYYASLPRVWGLSAVDDQQIAGLLMMVGGFTVLSGVLTAVFFIWFNDTPSEEERSSLARTTVGIASTIPTTNQEVEHG